MIRHIVLYWLKDSARIGEAVGVLGSMRGKIPGLLTIEAGKDTLRSDRSCDLCLHAVFESREALEAYRTHPAHLPVQRYMHSVAQRSASADFEVETL
jgi:hypothetical protein